MSSHADDLSQPATAPRQRPGGEVRRQDLVAAAYQIIAERGFEGLRVREVAGRAGVNIATLHYYFASKDALVHGVVEYILSQFLTVTAPALAVDTASAPQQLRGMFADLRHQLQEMPQMFLVLTELHLRTHRDPAVGVALRGLNQGWHAYVRGIFAEGIQQGLFRPDLDPDHAASLLIALIKGMSLQAVGGIDSFDFERIGGEIAGWLAIQRAAENAGAVDQV
jgi:AcrR family transcriptional regulator